MTIRATSAGAVVIELTPEEVDELTQGEELEGLYLYADGQAIRQLEAAREEVRQCPTS